MSKNSKSEPEGAHKIHGVLPVFQTPFYEDETIDFATLEQEIHWLYDQGSDGIVMGMVSETLRLSSEEREQLAEAACRFGVARGPVGYTLDEETRQEVDRLFDQLMMVLKP